MNTSSNSYKIIIYCLSLSILIWAGCQNSDSGETATISEEETTDQQPQTQTPEAPTSADEVPQIQPATDVSDADLKLFVAALMQIQVIQQSGQSKMIEAVQAGGMDLTRFSEIMQQKNNPTDTTTLSDEEQALFSKVDDKLREVEKSLQGDSEKAITDAGMTIESYQSILMTLRQDTSMQRQVQAMMLES